MPFAAFIFPLKSGKLSVGNRIVLRGVAVTIFGERLRALREAKHENQVDVGKALGVTSATISAYETGVREPPPAMLKRLADYFRVSTDYMLGRSDIATTGEVAPLYDAADLKARWPKLSPERRRKAADLERNAKDQGIELHLGNGLTDEDFDALLREVAVFAAFVANQANREGEGKS